MIPATPVVLDDESDAQCPGDESVDWSRVEELDEMFRDVGDDKQSAMRLYERLAGQ